MSKPLVRNKKHVRLHDFASLASMFAPPAIFLLALCYVWYFDARFEWLGDWRRYPFEFWLLASFGTVATVGGLGDWLFHRTYVAVGPNEHKAHLLALCTGGLPLFALMAGRPSRLGRCDC